MQYRESVVDVREIRGDLYVRVSLWGNEVTDGMTEERDV